MKIVMTLMLSLLMMGLSGCIVVPSQPLPPPPPRVVVPAKVVYVPTPPPPRVVVPAKVVYVPTPPPVVIMHPPVRRVVIY